MKKINGKKLGLGKKTLTDKPDKKPTFVNDGSPRLQAPRKEKLDQPLDNMRMGELVINRMSHDGRGIASWNNKTCFVEGALVGEKITARLMQNHARYVEARIDQLLEASVLRTDAACPHYAECGGCQLQHTDYENQLAIKQAAAFDQIEKGADVKAKHYLPPILSTAYGYRRIARFAVDARGGKCKIGFRKSSSHDLVDIRQCDVLVPELNSLVLPLKQLLKNIVSLEAIGHIDLLAADKLVLVIRQLKILSQDDTQKLKAFEQEQNCHIYLQADKTNQLQDLQGEKQDPRLFYWLEDFDLRLGFHPLDFIQVNHQVNQLMIRQALALLDVQPHERVLDLFCGIGNFTLPLAKLAKSVVGIEGQEVMVARAKENALSARLNNVEFVAADLEKIGLPRLRQICGALDAVLLDPPRDGAKTSLPLIAQLSPKRLVYVSCNPATLARDAKTLASAGYTLVSLGVMDMFPQTAHLESMALFVRK